MVRSLLTPRWMVLHSAVLIVVPVMVWLGFWQWRIGIDRHSPQSTGYAFQWWVFALFAIGLWARLVRDELRGASPDELTPAGEDAYDAMTPSARGERPLTRYRAPQQPVDVGDESELGRYNAYLAQLRERDDAASTAQSGPASPTPPTETTGETR